VIPDNTVYVLIDFDNFYTEHYKAKKLTWLIHELNKVITEVLNYQQYVKNIFVRLYGGWMENGMLTPTASLIQQELSTNSIFPMPHPKSEGLLRGNIEIATKLISIPNNVWDNTKKSKNGLPNIRVEHSALYEHCHSNTDRCPVLILKTFLKKKTRKCSVVGCDGTNESVFKTVEQKMVDTLLSCDLLHLSNISSVLSIIVMTDDFDIHPAIATARNGYNNDVMLIYRNIKRMTDIVASIGSFNVALKIWEV
jgi:hypothetical protein